MKPVIVIVHGAWHVPKHYEPFTTALQAHGFEVHVPHLPTSGDLASKSSFEGDALVVLDLLFTLVQAGRNVVVVAHSYGGAVATQALDLFAPGDNNTQPGKIVHLLYMCSFMLQPGQSTISASQPRPDPDPVEPANDGTCSLCQPPRDLFYADVEDGLAKKSEDLLQRHSLAALAGEINYPAWKHFPTTYIRCTEDRILFLHWQDELIQAVRDNGVELEVETYQASHSPFLSRTAEMVDVVERIAGRYYAPS